uniref:type I restriction endonuclease n=1 Tax=Desulforapulum autotrophicum TaxID=2296 RepID=UPI0038B9D663
MKTNEAIYDLITLGTALEQAIEGDSKSFNMNYIDWRNPSRNRFHVTAEYSVERSRSTETARPDIVLFVNGIPFCVIECKAPQVEVEFGFIVDYANVLGELDKALTMYSAFEGFDESDLVGTLTAINSEIEKLPGRYSDLWDLFKTVKHFYDEEAYELLLADESLREEFYDRLSDFGKTLGIALSCEKFLTEVDGKILSR